MVVYEVDRMFMPQMHINDRWQDKYGEIIVDGGVYAEYAENAVVEHVHGVMLYDVHLHWDMHDRNGELIALDEEDVVGEVHAIVYPIWDSIGSDMFIPNDRRVR